MVNEVQSHGDPGSTRVRTPGAVRLLSLILILLLVSGYTLALITGVIAAANRIDTTDLLLIAMAAVLVIALIRPDFLQHITIFELGSSRSNFRGLRKRRAISKAPSMTSE